jgi:hypothetical protein
MHRTHFALGLSRLSVVVALLGAAAPWATPAPPPPPVYWSLTEPLFYDAVEPGHLPGWGWWTSLTMMNLGDSNAVVIATAYDMYSNNTYTAQSVLPPRAPVTFRPQDFAGLGQGFVGSVLVSSDQPITAIATLTDRQTGLYGMPGGVASAQVEALQDLQGWTSVYFPNAKRAFGSGDQSKTTMFSLLNGGPSTIGVTVTAVYACTNGQTYTVTLPSFISMVFTDPSAAGVPANQQCTTAMTATQPIVGTAFEHYDVETAGTLLEESRMLSAADAATRLYAPAFKKRYPNVSNVSRTSTALVQNVSAGAIDVTATYTGAPDTACAGTTWSETRSGVAPAAVATFVRPSGLPDGCLAAAQFAGTGAIAGIVREEYLDPEPGPGMQSAGAYNLMPDGAATNWIAIPAYQEQDQGTSSHLFVQNTMTTTAGVRVVFYRGTEHWQTITSTVPAGQALDYYLVANQPWLWNSLPMPAGTATSAVVVADQPVVAVVVEQPYTASNPECFGQGGGLCEDRRSYTGFNRGALPLPPPEVTWRWYLPPLLYYNAP